LEENVLPNNSEERDRVLREKHTKLTKNWTETILDVFDDPATKQVMQSTGKDNTRTLNTKKFVLKICTTMGSLCA
jgi:lauroyl/myristoyl acyltransferase